MTHRNLSAFRGVAAWLAAGISALGSLSLTTLGATEALPVTYYDFLGQDSSPVLGVDPHPDFRLLPLAAPTPGLVQNLVGPTGPLFLSPGPAGTPQLTSAANFGMWYTPTPNFNLRIQDTLSANILPTGQREFDYPQGFFPLDGRGLGDYLPGGHNFHFTMSYRQSFVYDATAPNLFRFASDDDLWVFVNGQLWVDLGGMHPADPVALILDLNAAAAGLGLVDGQAYSYDLFFAERHTPGSALVATLPGPVSLVPEGSTASALLTVAATVGVVALRRRKSPAGSVSGGVVTR